MQVFLRLIQRDMYVSLPTIKRRTINTIIWTALLVYVFEYVGLSTVAGYGLFIAASECASVGFMQTFSKVTRIIGDLQGQRSITYYLTLPLPQWLLFMAMAISISLEFMIVNASIFPIAKLILGTKFPLSWIVFFKAICVFVCAHLLYGFCVLLFASMTDTMAQIASLRIRVADMLFWSGAYFFAWYRLYEKSHFFAYLDLLNPLVYANEGMRSAVFGGSNYLSVWLCCVVLLAFTAVVGTLGIKRMMKKVDCL